MRVLAFVSCLLFAVDLPAASYEPQPPLFDAVGLSTQAEAEVDNDQVEATLFAEREGNDAAQLADAVNREMDWALQQLKGAAGIDASTPAYQTYPLYQQGRITGWRVRQSLRLTGTDAAAISAMLSKLQTRLKLEGVHFRVSPQQRRQVEERLTREALARFTGRAAMIAKELGRGGYRLVSLQVNGNDRSQPRPVMAAALRADAVAAPRLEGGTSQVQVTVSGTIQLKD